MLVVRILPPKRAAEILGFCVGAMSGLLCLQLGNFASSLGRDVNISGTRARRHPVCFHICWLPLNWAGQGLVALGERDWLSGGLLFWLGHLPLP